MSFINFEIKARTNRPDQIREYLISHGAEFKGTDYQTDTYFSVRSGRLKLRQGNIENNLIYYERSDEAGPKQSGFQLFPVADAGVLKDMLAKAIGIKTVVQKQREIYFIANVKFHIDTLEGLGNFVEIEASNRTEPSTPAEKLEQQCRFYMEALGIREADLLQGSYSDMLSQEP